MKVAFIHDWYTLPGGAEKVARQIIDVLQPAEIYALFNFMPAEQLAAISAGKVVHTSFIQQIPKAAKYYRYLAPLFPKAIQQFDLSDFDIIVSSSWMAAKGVRKREGQVHLCYCHTPMRFAWDMEEVYLKQHGLLSGWKRKLTKFFIQYLKSWDIENAQQIDHFIANSKFVAKRIKTAYGVKSKVIYPPVDTAFFIPGKTKKEFYFTASRLVDYKNIDLLLETFKRLPKRQLFIAGQGPQLDYLRKLAPSNVHFLGWIPDDMLLKYMQEARAFINASIEDFGISGVEAQACGTPVIALGKGGYLETVIEDVTGLFFFREHPEALADAILRFERSTFDPFTIRKHAKQFDSAVFRENFVNHFLDKCFESTKTMA
jgi:glycosyltransferase involved in cell wall biosynthesis